MTKAFGVSRTVVRDSIAALTNEGLIRPVQGKGSYVRGCSVPELVITRTPGDPWASLLPEGERTAHVGNANEFWAERFEIPEESVIFHSEQTMTHYGRRIHTVRTLPSPRLEEIGTDPGPDPFQDRATLIALLARRFGPLHETDHSEPTMPSPDYLALLAVPPGTPLSVVTRLTRTREGLVLMAETERANSEGLAYAWPL
jgi:DNA-binding GntR family transcriptional regulator